MKRYKWIHVDGTAFKLTCERLEVRDNRVDFIGPNGSYVSIHNDYVFSIERVDL